MANIDVKNSDAKTAFTNKPLSAGEVEQSNGEKSAPLIAESTIAIASSPVSKSSDIGLTPPKGILRSIAVPAVTPAPENVHVFVATFAVREPNTGKIHAEVVEVPHTQNPQKDIDAAWKIVRLRFPKVFVADIRRTAGRVISRPGGNTPVIVINDGETIRQLFPDRSEFEAARAVGTVIFDGALCDVILRHLRAKSAFSVTLRQPGGTIVNFSEQITTNRLSVELPKIIAEIIGTSGQTLKLYFHKQK
jgi:hypothetical protein